METPNGTNGSSSGVTGPNAPGSHTGVNGVNGTAILNGTSSPLDGRWKCSDRQRDLILKIVAENQLDKHSVEELAFARFGHGVRLLNKLEASGLINELIANHGGNPNGGTPQTGSNSRSNGSAYSINQRRKDIAA
jgi:hypothetical protein